MTKKRTMGLPKMSGGIIDYKKVEKRGSFGSLDIFEAGRKEVKKMSKSYKKKHGRSAFKWTM